MKTTKITTTNKGQSIEQVVQKKMDEINLIVQKIDWGKLASKQTSANQ
jgi:hypothetical protein